MPAIALIAPLLMRLGFGHLSIAISAQPTVGPLGTAVSEWVRAWLIGGDISRPSSPIRAVLCPAILV